MKKMRNLGLALFLMLVVSGCQNTPQEQADESGIEEESTQEENSSDEGRTDATTYGVLDGLGTVELTLDLLYFHSDETQRIYQNEEETGGLIFQVSIGPIDADLFGLIIQAAYETSPWSEHDLIETTVGAYPAFLKVGSDTQLEASLLQWFLQDDNGLVHHIFFSGTVEEADLVRAEVEASFRLEEATAEAIASRSWVLSEDLRVVGDEERGFVQIPTNWIEFQDARGGDDLQFTDFGLSIVTLNVVDLGDHELDTRESADFFLEVLGLDADAFHSETAVQPATINGMSGYQFMIYYASTTKVLNVWILERSDGQLQYVSVESEAQHITDLIHLVETTFSTSE